MKIAMTTLSSKILSQDKEHFAKLAVDAVMRLKVSNDISFASSLELGFQDGQWNLALKLHINCNENKK